MTHLLLLSLLTLSATVPVSAQEQPTNQDKDSSRVERAAAPSPTASVQELEEIGDLLRSKKDYLDAIDYYRAGLLKSDSTTMHNKIGICLIQLQRYGDSKK